MMLDAFGDSYRDYMARTRRIVPGTALAPLTRHRAALSPSVAGAVERDLFDPRLGLLQQFLAAAFQRLAALIDRDRFLERHLAAFKPLDDRFKFLDRLLEGQLLDVGSFQPRKIPNS